MLKLLLPIVVATVIANVHSHASGQCAILATGSAVTPPPIDNWTASIPLGFTFLMNGVPYTGIYVSDHGLVALHNNGTPAAPGSGATLWSPSTSLLHAGGPLIAAYWSDHTVGSTGSIYIDNVSGSYATITWINHETYSQLQPAFSAQVSLFPDGRVVVCLDPRVQNQGSSFGALNAIVGVSEGAGGSLPLPSDLSANAANNSFVIYEEFTAPGVGQSNPNFDLANKVMTFSPTASGWQCTTVGLGCAAASQFGSGCVGLALASNLPVIGSNWDLSLTGMQAGFGLIFFGSAPLYPGVSMVSLGFHAPGCDSYLANLLSAITVFGTGGTAAYTVPIPANPGLKGTWLVVQGLSATSNLSSFTTSNGLAGTFGF